jgi:hypothetical protein
MWQEKGQARHLDLSWIKKESNLEMETYQTLIPENESIEKYMYILLSRTL